MTVVGPRHTVAGRQHTTVAAVGGLSRVPGQGPSADLVASPDSLCGGTGQHGSGAGRGEINRRRSA